MGILLLIHLFFNYIYYVSAFIGTTNNSTLKSPVQTSMKGQFPGAQNANTAFKRNKAGGKKTNKGDKPKSAKEAGINAQKMADMNRLMKESQNRGLQGVQKKPKVQKLDQPKEKDTKQSIGNFFPTKFEP